MVTISVIIPAFTMARWPQLRRAVELARRQSYPPIEVIVCIDNNQELYRTSREHWCHEDNTEAVPVRVIASNHAHDHQLLAAHAKAHGSRRRFGAGVARNRAAMVASGRVKVAPQISHVLHGLDKLPEAMDITVNKGKYRATNPAQIEL